MRGAVTDRSASLCQERTRIGNWGGVGCVGTYLAPDRSTARRSRRGRSVDYSVAVGFTDFGPGDVVYFPEGPFVGVCAVVREIDARCHHYRLLR